MNPNQKLLADMADIKGLDVVPWWPLAPGWWIVIGVIIAITFGIWLFIWIKAARKRRWQRQALNELSNITSVKELSVFIRRIALQKFQREECASLSGNDWLKWLKVNDPKKFDWEENGKLLLDAPYSPNGHSGDDELKVLIEAVKRWVK